jgi:hypothetical protein
VAPWVFSARQSPGVWRRAALPGWTGPGRAMVWAVSTEVAVLWFVVLFWGGYGTRHAVGDEPATAAAAPPLSTTLVFADQSECFAGCDGVPFTEHMQETLQMGQLLALNRTLCFASGANLTVVRNEAAEVPGRSIVFVGHMPIDEATQGGGHLNCSATGTFDECAHAYKQTTLGPGFTLLGAKWGTRPPGISIYGRYNDQCYDGYTERCSKHFPYCDFDSPNYYPQCRCNPGSIYNRTRNRCV